MRILRAGDRFRTRLDWLDSRHSFSFGEHQDPARNGFRSLCVLNDDVIAPGGGFGLHPHRNMEIVTYVLAGAVAHEDSTGGTGVIRPGIVQRMSAGRGIRHSERNASGTEPARLLQIWIRPDRAGHEASYEDRPVAAPENAWAVVAAGDGRGGSARIHQDAAILAACLTPGATLAHDLVPGRAAWIQIARGEISVGGEILHEGDGAALEAAGRVALRGGTAAEILLFDLGA